MKNQCFSSCLAAFASVAVAGSIALAEDPCNRIEQRPCFQVVAETQLCAEADCFPRHGTRLGSLQ